MYDEGYAYLLTALIFTLSLSEATGRSLRSLRGELLSRSDLGLDERGRKPVGCKIPSDFPTPTDPLAIPNLQGIHLLIYRNKIHQKLRRLK